MRFQSLRGWGLLVGTGLLFCFWVATPAQAHHLLEITGLKPNAFNGFLSGLAHPVLGPDHLLFLLALALLGLQRRLTWVIGLLVVGLAGSAAGLLWPGLPGAESLVSLSLVLEALVLLQRAPAPMLVPAMALHGYVLSNTVLGWSAMPLSTYVLGLLVSQGGLLLLALSLLRKPAANLSGRWRVVCACTLIGLGSAWALGQALG